MSLVRSVRGEGGYDKREKGAGRTGLLIIKEKEKPRERLCVCRVAVLETSPLQSLHRKVDKLVECLSCET